jgi:chromosome segregation ATPase
MFQKCHFISIFVFIFVFGGCTAFEYLDGSSEEEIKKHRMTRTDLERELKDTEMENVYLKERVDVLEKDNERIRAENEKAPAILKSKTMEKKKETEQDEKTDAQAVTDIGKLKIKVLSGDGNIKSAKKMASRLKKMGYDVKRVDFAPKSTFSKNTLFFAKGIRKQAEALSRSLGGSTVIKPLSWYSIFDIIVVTGRSG